MYLTIDDKYPTMPWDEIDAVVFDVGRVLLDFQPMAILRRYLPDHPELHETLLQRVFLSPYWAMRDRGVISQEEAIRAMTGSDDAIAWAVRAVMENWGEMKDVIDEGVSALRLCKEMGKKVYILSNYADEPFAQAEAKYDFIRLADERFVSSRLGMVKPEPCIYRHVVEATGHVPERMLFIDDSAMNVMAAMIEGWQGLCYTEYGKITRFFAG